VDFVRIVPASQFTGTPAPWHRPYAFYADAFSLHGRTVADCYRLVKGLTLPPTAGYYQKERRTPFAWDALPARDPDAPLAKLQPADGGGMTYGDYPEEWLERTAFVVLGVTLSAAEEVLDPFPATWRALSYIVSDSARMGFCEFGWDMPPAQFASARIHARFREVHARSERGLLAARSSKRELGLCDFDRLPSPEEELEYYGYLSTDSAFTNEIVELFGVSYRCWHGCGYLGWPGFPVCRFFLLRNLLPTAVRVLVLRGRDRFLYDPKHAEPGAAPDPARM
jgi:hypothetical protein